MEPFFQENDEENSAELFAMEFRDQTGMNFNQWKGRVKRIPPSPGKGTKYIGYDIMVQINPDTHRYEAFKINQSRGSGLVQAENNLVNTENNNNTGNGSTAETAENQNTAAQTTETANENTADQKPEETASTETATEETSEKAEETATSETSENATSDGAATQE